MSHWVEIATNAWYVIFAISFVLLMAASGARTFGVRWGEGLVPLAVGLQIFWVAPLLIYIAIKFAPTIALAYVVILLALLLFLGIAWLSGVFRRRGNS